MVSVTNMGLWGGVKARGGVKATAVNRKQVDVAASRSFRLSWNVLVTVSLSTVPRLYLLSRQSCGLRVGMRTRGEWRAVWPCVQATGSNDVAFR